MIVIPEELIIQTFDTTDHKKKRQESPPENLEEVNPSEIRMTRNEMVGRGDNCFTFHGSQMLKDMMEKKSEASPNKQPQFSALYEDFNSFSEIKTPTENNPNNTLEVSIMKRPINCNNDDKVTVSMHIFQNVRTFLECSTMILFFAHFAKWSYVECSFFKMCQ